MNPRKFALLRIAFGCVWGIDAFLKWQPVFIDSFKGQVTAMQAGQPLWIADWIQLWANAVSTAPHFFAVIVALAETAVAIGLIFGLFTRVALGGGMVLAFVIWAVPEGFGGPYAPGVTDIGAGIIYIFVLVALWLGASWRAYSLDAALAKRWPNFVLWRGGNAPTHERADALVPWLIFALVALGAVFIAATFPFSQSSNAAPMEMQS